MPERITVVCPNCSARLTVADKAKLGKKIRCPKCSKVFVTRLIAEGDSLSTKAAKQTSSDEDEFNFDSMPPDAAENEYLPPSTTSESRKRSNRGKQTSDGSGNSLPLIIGGVVAVMCLLAAGVYFLFGGRGEPKPEMAQQGPATSSDNSGNDKQTTSPSTAATPTGATSRGQSTGPSLPGAEPGIPVWVGQRKGEPFDVRVFLESRAAPKDNAAEDYLRAFAEVSAEMSFVYPEAEWQQRLPQVRALSQSIDNAAHTDKLRSGQIPLSEVERVLELAKPLTDKMVQAQQKPDCVFVCGLHIDSLLPHAQAARSLARLSQIELSRARSKGDYVQAHRSLERTLRLSRDLRRRGVLICQLVALAIDTMELTAVTDFTLSQPGLTVEDCDQLIGLLVTHQQRTADSAQEGFRMEYIFLRNTLEDLKSGRITIQQLVALLGSSSEGTPQQVQQFASIDWEAELAAGSQFFATALEHTGKPKSEVPADWEKKQAESFRTQNARTVSLLVPAIGTSHEAYWRGRSRLAGTIGLVAVRRHQLAHGASPNDLATALKEAKLTEPLIDAYSGKPMSYAVVNGKPVVYSVGPDLIDQGGTVDWNYGRQPGDFILSIVE